MFTLEGYIKRAKALLLNYLRKQVGWRLKGD